MVRPDARGSHRSQIDLCCPASPERDPARARSDRPLFRPYSARWPGPQTAFKQTVPRCSLSKEELSSTPLQHTALSADSAGKGQTEDQQIPRPTRAEPTRSSPELLSRGRARRVPWHRAGMTLPRRRSTSVSDTKTPRESAGGGWKRLSEPGWRSTTRLPAASNVAHVLAADAGVLGRLVACCPPLPGRPHRAPFHLLLLPTGLTSLDLNPPAFLEARGARSTRAAGSDVARYHVWLAWESPSVSPSPVDGRRHGWSPP